MNAVTSVWRLQLTRRRSTLLIPLWCTGLYIVITLLIALVFWRFGSEPGTSEWKTGMQYNPGIAYALSFYLVTMGVMAVATMLPFALMFGGTRRAFVGGTLLWQATVSVYLALVFVIMNALEAITHQWFVGLYIFNVFLLGAGDPVRLFLIVFFSVFALLSCGGVFASSWIRSGARGPQLLAVGAIIVLGLLVAILAPHATAIVSAFQVWWLLIVAVTIIGISSLGSWLLLRTAVIR